MKKTIKNTLSLLIALTLMLTMFNAFATVQSPTPLISYLSKLLGYAESDITYLYSQFDTQEAFLDEVDFMLSEIVAAEQWDVHDTTLADLDEISTDLNVDSELLQRHINICGEEYFNKKVCSNSIMLLADETISATLFNLMYNNAHTGNLFLTKDNVTASYRHGHVGIVSSHTSGNKKIVEAVGYESNDEDEVVQNPLTDWNDQVTLAVYYPSNTTTTQRENAGFYATQMLTGTSYTALVKKNQAVDLYPRMNCISLVYLAYLMSIGNNYDLVPQTAATSYLYPSHVQFSTIIALKTANNGILRTANWNDYDWGWN